MLFTPGNCEKILVGTKTQTRRRYRDGYDHTFTPYVADTLRFEFADGDLVERVGASDRDRFRVGQSVPVQPGRGKYTIARIRIAAIRYCERAGDISEADAHAEGFGRRRSSGRSMRGSTARGHWSGRAGPDVRIG
jgi:hypothetical protein